MLDNNTTFAMSTNQAKAVAKEISKKYIHRLQLAHCPYRNFFSDTILDAMSYTEEIDTIVCMDGCIAVGTYIAEELSNIGNNKNKNIYVVSTALDDAGQLYVSEDTKTILRGKNILILSSSAMTENDIFQVTMVIEGFGGIINDFSSISEVTNKALC